MNGFLHVLNNLMMIVGYFCVACFIMFAIMFSIANHRERKHVDKRLYDEVDKDYLRKEYAEIRKEVDELKTRTDILYDDINGLYGEDTEDDLKKIRL